MRIALIVAAASNGVIGKENQLPWHLPEDLQYFKRTTMGKPIVMGRKTYESIGRPLPGRLNIVISRQAGWLPADEAGRNAVKVVASIEAAVVLAEAQDTDELMIIGGAQIYAAAIGCADRLYLTEVAAEIEGDARFEVDDPRAWKEVERVDHKACDKNPYDYAFVVLERVASIVQ